ncbi:MAG: FapA family protein [Planctomycetota bacterium]
MSLDALDTKSSLTISSDGLRATLRVEPGVDAAICTHEAVAGILRAQEVRLSAITEQAAERLAEKLAAGTTEPVEEVVAEGTPPRHGEDGRFELTVEVAEAEGDESEATADEDAVDHYTRSAFTIVRAGEQIGILHPPIEAIDGVDVRGEVLPARPGRSCSMKFGDGVEVREDHAVIATHAGRLNVVENGVRVQPTLVIEGSVDFSTGNIDFEGEVLVEGGVCDRFEVVAGTQLSVQLLVEAASIRCGGSIQLARGMTGRGKGTLACGGSVRATYLDDVTATIGADLIVAREITNSRVRVGRRVLSPTCTVIGGELIARYGGEIRTLGGEAGASAVLGIGEDPDLDALASLLQDAVPNTIKQLRKLREELTTISPTSGKPLPAHAEQAADLRRRISEWEAKLPRLLETINRVLDSYHLLSKAKLVVQRSICAGATVRIGGLTATFSDEVGGAPSIGLDASRTPVLRSATLDGPVPLANHAKIQRREGAVDPTDLERLAEKIRRERPQAAAA